MTPVLGVIAAGIVMVVTVALIVLALVFYLVSVIVALRKITGGLDEVIENVGEIVSKTLPVNGVVTSINKQLDTGVDLLEGLLVKKAGMEDALGLVDGLYPGAAGAGFRMFPQSASTRAPRIGEVYTKGTLTLARLGREAPIAAANPAGPVLRNAQAGSSAAGTLYPGGRALGASSLPSSPVIGSGAPVQYEQRQDIGAPRQRLPARPVVSVPASGTPAPSEPVAPAAPAGGTPPPSEPAAPAASGSPDAIRWKR